MPQRTCLIKVFLTYCCSCIVQAQPEHEGRRKRLLRELQLLPVLAYTQLYMNSQLHQKPHAKAFKATRSSLHDLIDMTVHHVQDHAEDDKSPTTWQMVLKSAQVKQFQNLDANGDGKIDYQEFCDLLKSQHQ